MEQNNDNIQQVIQQYQGLPLPLDLIKEITFHLTPPEVLELCKTSHTFNSLCQDPIFWRLYVKTRYLLDVPSDQQPREFAFSVYSKLKLLFDRHTYPTMKAFETMMERSYDRVKTLSENFHGGFSGVIDKTIQIPPLILNKTTPNIYRVERYPRKYEDIPDIVASFNEYERQYFENLEKLITAPTIYIVPNGHIVVNFNYDARLAFIDQRLRATYIFLNTLGVIFSLMANRVYQQYFSFY